MDGPKLIEQLAKKLDCDGDTELAGKLGYSKVGIRNFRDRPVTERIVAELVSKARDKAVEDAGSIRPIVEFFKLDTGGSFLSKDRPDHVSLAKLLSSACGLYSFYNSELEIIYVGKTVDGNLLTEAKNAYSREMLHYERYVVSHPHGRFAHANDGKARKISRQQIHLHQAASYFSAYSVHADLVSAMETLLIRMLPNDLLNVRMEGNTSLKPFTLED